MGVGVRQVLLPGRVGPRGSDMMFISRLERVLEFRLEAKHGDNDEPGRA